MTPSTCGPKNRPRRPAVIDAGRSSFWNNGTFLRSKLPMIMRSEIQPTSISRL